MLEELRNVGINVQLSIVRNTVGTICYIGQKQLGKDVLVEIRQRDHICRGSDQLNNRCKESRDYICKGSPDDDLT